MYLLVAKQLVIMTLLAIVSFVFSKKHGFGKKESEYLSNLLLFVISPCMIFSTLDIPFSRERLSVFIYSIIIGLTALLFMTAISFVLIHSKTDEGKKRDCLDKLSFVYSNAGFIGIPLINGVFGAEGLFPLMGYLAVFNFLLWTLGYYIVNRKIGLVQVSTNPNIISILLGLIFFFLPFKTPDVIGQTIKYLGDLNTPISMIILGLLFADFKNSQGKTNVKIPYIRVVSIVLIRLLLLPVMLVGLFKAILIFVVPAFALPLEAVKHVMMIVFIAASCPIGMTVVNFAVIYDKDETYAGFLVSLSSVVCVLSLPLMVKLAEGIL